ncbi:hypothetical protein [Legionella sp. km772]|uniref:hypothetical protein n=1 Tax=Legionella sp. km772 TaxID=2498111 RepID=UPI000F8F2A2C|nr:hypothetical protein [Legionella sp. km772]RUR10249.1 hypothetical protein ELY15_08375 [Legionella sp. km772]
MKKFSCLALGLLVLSSCSKYSSNGENLYLQSRNGQRVEVPPPLTSSNISNFYDLPEQTQNATVNIEPPVEATTF